MIKKPPQTSCPPPGLPFASIPWTWKEEGSLHLWVKVWLQDRSAEQETQMPGGGCSLAGTPACAARARAVWGADAMAPCLGGICCLLTPTVPHWRDPVVAATSCLRAGQHSRLRCCRQHCSRWAWGLWFWAWTAVLPRSSWCLSGSGLGRRPRPRLHRAGHTGVRLCVGKSVTCHWSPWGRCLGS